MVSIINCITTKRLHEEIVSKEIEEKFRITTDAMPEQKFRTRNLKWLVVSMGLAGQSTLASGTHR